ncbi:hypothetical protein FA15DRAFT_701893 [Coprinopsis marcescibilis]|uniref:Integral membrane protein n=1 Tax=Coprinopsis marcescibilis TaxID=230819 RepID=A0A5C3L457_COPMA|nr:hypothetical protein FA15DRAFT_701893 [Coprinopsis marcescibilis]
MADVTFYRQKLVVSVVSAGVEGVLSGMFIVLFSTTIPLLINPPTTSRIAWRAGLLRRLGRPLVVGSILLFLSIVAHWVCTLVRVIKIISPLFETFSAFPFMDNPSEPLGLAKISLIACTGSIADALLIWRLWILSDCRKLVALPPVIAYALVCASYTYTALLFVRDEGDDQYRRDWVQLSAAATILVNLYCSFGLACFLFRLQSHALFRDNKYRFQRLLTLTIESAAIWV